MAANKVRMRLLDYNGLLSLKRIFIHVLCQETIVRVCKSNVLVMVLLLVLSNEKQYWSTNRNTNIITVGLRAVWRRNSVRITNTTSITNSNTMKISMAISISNSRLMQLVSLSDSLYKRNTNACNTNSTPWTALPGGYHG